MTRASPRRDRVAEKLRKRLAAIEAPEHDRAEQRAWQLLEAAHAEREPQSRRRRGMQALVAGLLAAGFAALVLSSAGAKVGDLIKDAVGLDGDHPKPALTSLPVSQPLLVQSSAGSWLVRSDGSKRLLGAYRDVAWSPHGLYVAAATGHQLLALKPDGDPVWSVTRGAEVTAPTWSPSGVRVAYLNGPALRVVGGDGVGDRPIDGDVAAVAPVWRPPKPRELSTNPTGYGTHELAYVDADGHIHMIGADSGRQLWSSTQVGAINWPRSRHWPRFDYGPVKALQWSANGGRLLVVSEHGYSIFTGEGKLIVGVGRSHPDGVTISPNGQRIAVAYADHGTGTVLVQGAHPGAEPSKRVFSGSGRISGLTWSADQRWLLIGWRAANQWVFVRPDDKKVQAVGSIAEQFDPGATQPAFPNVAGWCCQADSR